jgi:ADP-ribose pyrophosphatase YjhB (NUDIX family)
MGKCSPEIWKIILENAPLVCVEAVITNNNFVMPKYLLGRRTQNPEKGLFGVIGGTVYRGESLEEALTRNLERETGIKKFNYQFIAHDSLTAENSEAGPGFHVISHIYKIKTNDTPQTTEENSEYKWFNSFRNSLVAPNAQRILSHVEKYYQGLRQ